MVTSGRDGRLALDTPATYRIRVAGGLDESWQVRLGGMAFTATGSGSRVETTLVGLLSDQAALVGVLSALYDLGLPILSVQCLEWES